MRRRLDQAASAMSGELAAGGTVPDAGGRFFAGAAIDSRRIRGGELFFALAGEHTDGHRFVGQALAAGAAAAVVAEPQLTPPAGAIVIRVQDTLKALHSLTRSLRRENPKQLLGLTGSVGKTTTKELLSAMLARRYRVAKSPGNLNNLLGFPLALLGIADNSEWMVAEMGMSTPGELAGVSELARPDVAMLLNVKPVHLENFGTVAAIAEAKAEILAGLPASGVLVANADDPEVARVARRHPGRIVWFSVDPTSVQPAEVRRVGPIEPLATGTGSRFTLEAPQGTRSIELALHGSYNVANCVAAAAAALTLEVSLDDVAAGAREARPAAGRGVVHALGAGITVIDDSYNSNPEALSSALASAVASGAAARRRWVVLGDMLELGEGEDEFHRLAGQEAAGLGFEPIVGVGSLARRAIEAAREMGQATHWFESATEAAEMLPRELSPGDLVLVKGSRGIGLEVVVTTLLARAEELG